MNFYLLQLLGKWVCFLVVSLSSLVGVDSSIKEYEIQDNSNKNISVLTEIIPYNTNITYNNSIPKNITKTISTGKEGIKFINTDGTEVVLQEVVNEEIEIGTGALGTYTGIITGYGPDCSTCSGRGYVACKTETQESFNLLTDGVYYNDSEYGSVRVLAAALTEFPCGTIIQVESTTLGTFMGIVLDTGYDMKKNYELGVYHFDVAYTTETDEMVAKTTDMSGNVIYNVQRWGW
jgi:hypothetical protein